MKNLKMFASVIVIGVMAIPAMAQGRPDAAHVPNQMIVKFKNGTSESKRAAARARVEAMLEERIETQAMRDAGYGDLEVLHGPPDFARAAATLRNNPDVEFVEPNWIYQHGAISNDTYYTNGSLWGMYGDATTPANQWGSQAGEAWAGKATVGSKTVFVGVIDEGIQVTHPDLNANIWVNSFDPVDGIDNDGNGYVDDTNGWDFANNDRTVYDGGTKGTLDKHGTHVAGTIGGVGGNSIGVAGVTWNVTMISGKFLGRNGGTTANAIKAVDYFTDLKTRHNLDIVATSNSWGGGGFSQALLDAINRGGEKNILFIAAAGNGGGDGVGDDNDVTPHYPSNYVCTSLSANYDCVISVASITNTGAKSGFSNFGKTSVDLAAPGSGINSTLPSNTYGSYSGTSMATPHVSGGAALRAATSTNRGAALKADIMNAAANTATASMNGICVTNGRLNVSGF